MMRCCEHRGLTLLEVLASLVIVALLAGVCVPMLRSASAVLGESQPADASQAQLELEALADAFLKDHAVFGIASLDELTTAQIASTDADNYGLVEVTRLTRDDENEAGEFNHDWLVFRHGDRLAMRFLMRPVKPQEPAR